MLLFGRIFTSALWLALQGISALSATTTHQDKPAHLQGRYLIKGQPPPPCVHHICPLARRSQAPADHLYLPVQQSGETNSETQANAEPISGSEESTATCQDGTAAPCSGQAKPVVTHQSAPITCGDGTKPPCGKAAGTASHPPDTHQTAPIRCGDGTKPPCGKAAGTASHPPDTHQTAPIRCGDGTRPPCGQTQPVAEGPRDFPDGTSGPCKPTGLAHHPPTHQTAPITCGDGTKPPCHGHADSPRLSPSFPGTRQTAPITCGDGSKPPCHSSAPIAL